MQSAQGYYDDVPLLHCYVWGEEIEIEIQGLDENIRTSFSPTQGISMYWWYVCMYDCMKYKSLHIVSPCTILILRIITLFFYDYTNLHYILFYCNVFPFPSSNFFLPSLALAQPLHFMIVWLLFFWNKIIIS